MVNRRELIVGAGLGLAAPALFGPVQAQQAAAAPAQPSRSERFATAATAARHRLDHSNGAFSGPAWDFLLRRGQAAHFFLLGEEHGIAENPKLAAALFRALVPSGYRKAAIEVSPPMAAEMDRALRGGIDGLRRMYANEGSQAAFFGIREEAEWIATVRASVPDREPCLWGCDYEVGGDRHLIEILNAKRKPATAAAALAALEAASTASWARYHETRNPQYIFSFGGDPALVQAVRAAWPRADAEAAAILETLEETLEINRLWVSGRGRDSNVRRAGLLRRNFLHHWSGERRAGRRPCVFMKFGASHMARGLSPTDTFDLGALVPEIAAHEGVETFQLLVMAGPTSPTLNFDPQAYAYRPGHRDQYQAGMELLTGQAWSDAFTLFDTAPLRAIARSNSRDLHPELVRSVHGFDAILVMSGSTAAAPL